MTGKAFHPDDVGAHPDAPLRDLPGHSSRGRLERVLRRGEFAVTAELSPPDSADPAEVYRRIAPFEGWVDAINATDGSGANCHMSSVAVAALLARVGYSAVLQISCRDHNRIAIQGHVLGAGALGVANVLCLTGDGVESGDHPEAKAVFDLDAITLIGAVKRMRDEGRFMSGRELTSPPRVFIGCAENPCMPPVEIRTERFAKKIEAGAQFVQTQYIFDVPAFAEFMARARDLGLLRNSFVLAGVGPLASAKTARWMNKHVPGVTVPEDVIARLERAADPRAEGKRVCIEIIQRLREIEGVAGVHVMAYRQEEYVSEIVHESGILRGRRPWRREIPPTPRTAEPISDGSRIE